MLDALLETIGILGALGLLAIRLGKPYADAMARKADQPDRPHETVRSSPSMRDACPHRRQRKGNSGVG